MHSCTLLQSLNNSLFSNCLYLTEIQFPPSIKEMRHGCFFNTVKLLSVNIPDSLEVFLGFSDPDQRMFSGNLQSVNISPNSNLIAINSDVFFGSKITSFYIPKNVSQISAACFAGATIQSFTIHPENVNFKTDGLIIYSGSNNSTIHCVARTVNIDFVIPSFVTVLGDHCFRLTKIKSITLHDNVNEMKSWVFGSTGFRVFRSNSKITSIETATFKYCSNLEEVYLSSKTKYIKTSAFAYCSKLRIISLPDDLVELGDACFERCPSLNDLVMPASVTKIGAGIFKECSPTLFVNCSLNDNFDIIQSMLLSDNRATLSTYFNNEDKANITVPSQVKSISKTVFARSNLYSIKFSGNAEMKIGVSAFESCAINTIEFPPGLSSLGVNCFRNCPKLETVTFSGSLLTAIPDECFLNCNSLKNIILPQTIETIGASSFKGCSKISDIGLSSTSLITVKYSAFQNSGLSKCELPSTLQTLDVFAFAQTSIVKISCSVNIPNQCFQEINALKTVELGEGVVTIGEDCFSSCGYLETVTIPSSILTISYFAFKNCWSLRTFKIGLNSNLNEIQGGCFFGCVSLMNITLESSDLSLRFSNGALTDYRETKIIAFLPSSNTNIYIIPTSMKYIGASAFEGATKLQRILFNGNQLETIGFRAFKGCRNLNFLYFSSDSLQSIGANAFEDCPLLHQCGTISCPQTLQSKFKSFTKLSFEVNCPIVQCSNGCDISFTRFAITAAVIIIL